MLINRLLQVLFVSGAVSLVVPALAHPISSASPSIPLCGDDEDSHKGVKKDDKKKDDADPGKDVKDGEGDDEKDKDGEEPAAA